MNAVIYARYSSDNQREESIEGQLRECGEFAKRKGYTIVKTYADRAISGKKADNRPQFMQMINDSECAEFDIVIVWKIDRFSRDKYDSVIYKSKLNKNGVSVLSATEPIDDSPEGKLMESIFEGFPEYYIKDLALKTSRGMTENAIKGKFNGGSVTFGYTIDENRLFHPDTIYAPIVTSIFKRYADGETIKSILEDLSSKGIKNKNKPISYHFINWLLKNRRYLGEYTFRDTVNENAIPPLVTHEIFEKCQKRLEANAKKPASFKAVEDKFILTGKIFCGHCGDSMSGTGGTSKSKVIYRYYQCMSSKKKKCDKKRTQKSFIEDTVVDLAMQIFENKQLMANIVDSCYAMQTTKSTELPALKKQLKQTKKEINNVMNAVKAGLFNKTMKSTLDALEAEQENLEIAIVREQIERPIISKEQIEFWIMRFSKTDCNNAKQKQRLIDIFVNSVYVYNDKMVVTFNYKDGEKCIDFEAINAYKTKKNTQINECSSLLKSGDPYGN